MDDLLDLDWSPAKQAQGQSKPQSKPAQPKSAQFDLLAANGRNYSSSSTPLRSSTPSKPSRSSTPQPPSGTSDAFSSLFNLSSTSTQTLSLAEQQAQLAEEKRKKAEHERLQFHAEGSFWDNLGQTAPPAAGPARAPAPKAAAQPTPTLDLLSPTLAPTASASQSSVPSRSQSTTPWDDDDDDDDDFLPSSSKPAPPSSAKPDPFDFDALEAAVPQSSAPQPPQPSHDDLLGDLGRPAPKARSTSPPPHIVGQIVEMGFSPAQARAALAKTPTGQDVQAALDSLLQSRDDGSSDEDRVLRERARREEEEAAERRRRRRAGPSRDSVQARSREEIERSQTPRGEYQTDKIIAQASEIGQNMFTKGMSLWNSGKERAIKAYEEQKKAMEAEKRKEPRDGRPRWMVDESEVDQASPGFKDSDDEAPRTRPGSERPKERPMERPRQQRPASPKHDLLIGDGPKSYQPASRRAPTSRQPARAPVRAPPTPAPLIQRQLVPASPSQIQSAAAAKTKGNDHFKLGRFSEAEVAYSSAITSLPDGHILLVNLYNNRASTRLKLGEAGGAATDATAVVEIVGVSYHPSKEAPLPPDLASEVKLSDALVKAFTKRAQAWEMGEKWSKAVEDWERLLGFDFALLGPNGAATRTLASDGVRRSKKMLSGDKPRDKPKPAPKPAPKPSSAPSAPSQAVLALRKANEAAEKEEEAKADAKADVDAKITAWKTGKETNIRALISSLDTVLWDEILAGGLKVGMHEVITEKQVKIKYMKVIARLHPDKLSVGKTTVEQRMLANSAFSVLNEAWQAFQSGA